jgi:succinate-semialdehyde dehydrogenase/glutarate-semialdehyde dehydrogenase
MFVGGGPLEPAGGDRLEVLDPATAEPFEEVPAGTPAEVDAAVAAAGDAFEGWWATPAARRGELLHEATGHTRDHTEELTASLTREQGKPLREARLEIERCLETLEHYAGLAKSLRGGYVPNLDEGAYGVVLRRPLGVVGAIVPWNFPTTLLANKLGPALVAGNTVVAKPAETTPLTTLAVARLAAEAGLPPGVLNVVTGGPATGEALVAHPGVRRVAFTGQTVTGRRIMELAGPALKHVSLELGGSDPTIVLADADLDAAVKNIQIGRYWNCGQACLAPKRAFVQAGVYDAFVEQLASRVGRYEPGPGATRAEKPKLRIGPLHTAAQRDLLTAQLKDAVDRGAKAVVGGEAADGPGHFFSPAVVVDVPPDNTAMQNTLNEYGAAGWELVVIGMGDMTSPRLVFKK